MATLVINGQSQQVPDDSPLAPACRTAGLLFNCNGGICGSCLIEILAGAENLSPATAEEQELGVGETKRLACQCRIQSGVVKIKF